MRESQYIEPFLNTTAEPATRWTPDTYLAYTLHGKAKDYSSGYRNALMRAISRRLAAGAVTQVPSKGGSTTFIRAWHAVIRDLAMAAVAALGASATGAAVALVACYWRACKHDERQEARR